MENFNQFQDPQLTNNVNPNSFFKTTFMSNFGLFIISVVFSYLMMSIFSSFFGQNKSLKMHYATFAMLLFVCTTIYKIGNMQSLTSSGYFHLLVILTPILYSILTSFIHFDKSGSIKNLIALFLLSFAISGMFYLIYQITSTSNQKNVHYIIGFITVLWFIVGLSIGDFKINNYILLALIALHARYSSMHSIILGGVSVGLVIQNLASSKKLSLFKDKPVSKTCLQTTTPPVDAEKVDNIIS